MASILTYWQLPDEEKQFLAYLDKSDILACASDHFRDPADVTSHPLRELLTEDGPERVVFTLRDLMNQAEITSYEKDGRRWYHRFYMNGPLISYTRPHWREPQQLGRAKLCYESRVLIWDGVNEDLGYLQPQPPEFLAWARRVYRWIRRHTQPHGYYRASPGVLAELENGLDLVH